MLHGGTEGSGRGGDEAGSGRRRSGAPQLPSLDAASNEHEVVGPSRLSRKGRKSSVQPLLAVAHDEDRGDSRLHRFEARGGRCRYERPLDTPSSP